MAFDIKEFVTKKEGPLPVWGWVAVGAVGYLLYRHFAGGSSSNAASTTANQPSPVFTTGGGTTGGGSGSGATGGLFCASGMSPDPTGTFCIPTAGICLPPNSLINGVCTTPAVTNSGTSTNTPAPVPSTGQQSNCFQTVNGVCYPDAGSAANALAAAQQAAQQWSLQNYQATYGAVASAARSAPAASSFVPASMPVGYNAVTPTQIPYLGGSNQYTPYGTQAYGSMVNYNPFGSNAAPQVINPQTVYSSTFGSGSSAFQLQGHYVGDCNNGGCVWVPG